LEQSLNKQIVSFLVIVFLFSGNNSFAAENLIDHPVIDSSMTLKEALEGLDPNCPETIESNQTLLDVMYYTTDGLIHNGQIIIDRRLVDDVDQVFQIAFDIKFPFVSVIPVSQFDWSDADSMAHNNTSGFNYRETTGSRKLSNHAYGYAIDYFGRDPRNFLLFL